MVIFSASSCSLFSTNTTIATAPTARVSAPSSSYSSTKFAPVFCLVAVKSSSRKSPCLVSCVAKLRGMAEIVEDKKESKVPVSASSSEVNELGHSCTFLDARTEEDLLSRIRKEMEAGRLPLYVARGMEELYQNYRNAVLQSGDPKANEIVLSNMAVAFDRISIDVKDPFAFSPHHRAIREPFDYYMFGQNYIRPLIDFQSSYVGNLSIFYEIEEKLQQGENVVLMSNHQTEADPAVISLLLEKSNPYFAENITYLAGDRVITDPLCKPFSMGRNLLCVYSKKHMHDDPELTEMKRRANTRSLKEMALLLRGGSKLIWIAPSGGRDRPNPATNEWCPAPFDTSSVDNMRRLVEHAGVRGHIYPLAILCYDVMPPPPQVEKDIGEKRVISFHGVGLSVASKISFEETTSTYEDSEQGKEAYVHALFESVNHQYNVLKNAIHGQEGLRASAASVTLSQPWL